MTLLDVLADRLGNRVEHRTEPGDVGPDGAAAGMRAAGGMERNREGHPVRLDEGHPLPELVAEIVSPTSEVRDLEDKPARYAALGIVEYLACHPGDLPDPEADDPGSPAKLRLFRLQPDGTYRQAMDAAAGFSRVCGTQVRLWQPNVRRMAHFQWWDKARGRWREAEHTREVERDRHARELQETRTASLKEGEARGREEGLAEGEAKMAVAALHSLLPALPTRKRGQVAAYWYRHGPPTVPADAGYTRRTR